MRSEIQLETLDRSIRAVWSMGEHRARYEFNHANSLLVVVRLSDQESLKLVGRR